MMEAVLENITRPLSKSDRCDRCQAEAKMVARNSADSNMELLFCEHHVNEHREGLLSSGFYFDTETLEARN